VFPWMGGAVGAKGKWWLPSLPPHPPGSPGLVAGAGCGRGEVNEQRTDARQDGWYNQTA
jgi:hypothetical protein